MAFELAEKEPRKRTGASAEPLNKQKFLQPPGGQRHPKVNDKIMSEPPNKTRDDDTRRLPSALSGTAVRKQSRSSQTQRPAPFASLIAVSVITINDCTLSPDLLAVLENASREKKAATPAPALSSKTLMSSSYSASGE